MASIVVTKFNDSFCLGLHLGTKRSFFPQDSDGKLFVSFMLRPAN